MTLSLAPKALTRVQVGKESTRGTAVASTRRLVSTDAVYTRTREQEEFLAEMNGALARTVLAPVDTMHQTDFEFTIPLDFEQVLLPCLSGLRGGITPSTPGTGAARLWVFTLGNSDPLIDTYTIEYAVRNAEASIDEMGFESPYGFTTGISIQGGDSGLPQATFTMVGRKSKSATSTGAIALPTRTHAANGKWSIYVDDTWANLGTAQISAQVHGFTWSLEGHVAPERFLDGRVDLDFSGYIPLIGRVVDLSLDVTINPDATGFIQEEIVHRDAGDLRFVEVAMTGAAFVAPDAAFNHFVKLDGAYFHAPDSMSEFGADRNGMMTANMHLLSAYDATGANDIQVQVQNTLATFP